MTTHNSVRTVKSWRWRLARLLLGCSVLGAGLLAQGPPADSHIVIILGGTGAAQARMVPDVDGDGNPDEATCWDANLIDPKTNLIVGTGSECLSFADLDGQGEKPVATTTFNFRNGTLVQRGKISIQPVLWDPADNPDVDPNVTVVTGAFPAPGVNNILSGTGRFAGRQGRARLSGAAYPREDGSATLNCIFIIDLY